MRDFAIFRRRKPERQTKWFAVGKHPLPFTQEVRHYVYLWIIGVEWWTGLVELAPDTFREG